MPVRVGRDDGAVCVPSGRGVSVGVTPGGKTLGVIAVEFSAASNVPRRRGLTRWRPRQAIMINTT